MAERRGMKEVLKITFPRLPPYKLQGDYLQSKAELDRVHYRSYEWDKPRHDPELHFTASRRILDSTTQALADRREFAKKERLKLDAQWTDLEDKEEKLKETFMQLSQFIKGNEEKRQRAKELCREDRILRMERTNEVDKLEEKMASMQDAKTQMDKNIGELKIYAQYLDQVVVACNDFKNSDHLIARYEALVTTRTVLGNRQDTALKELESARTKTTKMTEENSFYVLGLNNMVAQLHARYQAAHSSATDWENVVIAIRNRSYRRFQEINEVKQSCWNVYVLMCQRKGETPKIPDGDFEKQLNYIKKTLQELKTVKEKVLAEKPILSRKKFLK